MLPVLFFNCCSVRNYSARRICQQSRHGSTLDLALRLQFASPPTLCYGVSERKEFSSRNEAIAFAESNYWFVPLRIVHGKATLACPGKTRMTQIPSSRWQNEVRRRRSLTQSYCNEERMQRAHDPRALGSVITRIGNVFDLVRHLRNKLPA